MGKRLGDLERKLFAWTQMRGQRVIRNGDLTGPLGISPVQERELLSRMARSMMIARVRRGLYLVPDRLPLGASWTPDPIQALSALMEDADASWQICGPNTFYRYGYTGQLPVRWYVYNNRISGERTIGSAVLNLIKVDESRIGGVEISIENGFRAVYSSRARTLVDAVYDWSRFNSLPGAYEWIRQDLRSRAISAEELVEMTVCYGNTGTIRRIGAMLDRLEIGIRLLDKLEKVISQSSSYIPWIPGSVRKGSVDKRWGIIWNDENGENCTA